MEKPPYYTILAMINIMDEPYRSSCRRSYDENKRLFREARGSTHNHQAWLGGYHDHIQDMMNYAILFWCADARTWRPMPFTVSDALVASYLHDFEKPWRFRLLPDGTWEDTGLMKTKADRQAFREAKIAEYGIVLSPVIANAVKYAEGEGADYRSDRAHIERAHGLRPHVRQLQRPRAP